MLLALFSNNNLSGADYFSKAKDFSFLLSFTDKIVSLFSPFEITVVTRMCFQGCNSLSVNHTQAL